VPVKARITAGSFRSSVSALPAPVKRWVPAGIVAAAVEQAVLVGMGPLAALFIVVGVLAAVAAVVVLGYAANLLVARALPRLRLR
jgi:hypothetical protein